MQQIDHPFPPVVDENCRILILGSFPSVKSRADGFFYGHPQNRFWKVISGLMNESVPVDVEEKRKLLLKYDIAIWDVIQSCDIKGSSDSSIKNVTPTDLASIVEQSRITKVFCNGKTSGKLYEKYQSKRVGIDAMILPSTSPANAAYSLERLMDAWRVIKGGNL